MTSIPGTPTPPLLDAPPDRTRATWRAVLELLRPFLALLLIFGFFWWNTEEHRFGSLTNMQDIAVQTVIVCIAAYGMTFVIISSGIDLSAGSMIAISAAVAALILHHGAPPLNDEPPTRWPWLIAAHPLAWPLLAVACGLLVGMLCGLVNALAITGLRVVPFIVTLGTMLLYRGMATGFCNEKQVNYNTDCWVGQITWPVKPPYEWMIFPPALWITLFLGVIMMVVLKYTRFGRHVFAVGSNEQTARLCGVPVTRVKLLVYSLGGFCCGLAGVMFLSRQHQAEPHMAEGLELNVIAAVVIGGGSLSGGKGSIMGTVIGALIMSVIAKGLPMMLLPNFLVPTFFASRYGLPTYWQNIVTGAIIIMAAALDRGRQRRSG